MDNNQTHGREFIGDISFRVIDVSKYTHSWSGLPVVLEVAKQQDDGDYETVFTGDYGLKVDGFGSSNLALAIQSFILQHYGLENEEEYA